MVALDFDGTLFLGEPPKRMKPHWPVIEKAKDCKRASIKLAMFTTREGHLLEMAVEQCRAAGLEFDAINENVMFPEHWNHEVTDPQEKYGQHKIFAHLYVDDAAPGSVEFFLNLDLPLIRILLEQNRKALGR